jgi:hypothetical protein
MHTLATRILDELSEALADFGTHSFDDKGAGDVVDTDELGYALRKLAPAEAAAVLLEVARYGHSRDTSNTRRALRVAEALVLSLQDWDALFEIPCIDGLMNGELPTRPGAAGAHHSRG